MQITCCVVSKTVFIFNRQRHAYTNATTNNSKITMTPRFVLEGRSARNTRTEAETEFSYFVFTIVIEFDLT